MIRLSSIMSWLEQHEYRVLSLEYQPGTNESVTACVVANQRGHWVEVVTEDGIHRIASFRRVSTW